jgi:putative NIF3 family GTP cyclohydrolase 1 type 2
MVGNLEAPIEVRAFLTMVKQVFNLSYLRVGPLSVPIIRRVAVCGGAGYSLIPEAVESGADIFLSGDINYHFFFSSESKMIVADIGHYESEIGIVHKLSHLLLEKNLTFAVSITKNNTNPVHYF